MYGRNIASAPLVYCPSCGKRLVESLESYRQVTNVAELSAYEKFTIVQQRMEIGANYDILRNFCSYSNKYLINSIKKREDTTYLLKDVKQSLLWFQSSALSQLLYFPC